MMMGESDGIIPGFEPGADNNLSTRRHEMEKRGLIVLLVLAMTGSALACSAIGGATKGSGRIVTSEVDVRGFSGVTFAGFGNLYIEVGSAEELRIEVDDNLISYFEAEVDNKMLTIKVKEGASLEPSDEVNFYLTVKELDTIVLTGAGKIESAALRAEQFSVDLSGAGDLTLAGLNAGSLNVDISGAGSLEIESGWVDEQTVDISGAGDYKAEGLQSGSASLDITGAGSATVWAVTELAVTGSGVGKVEYAGNPQLSTEGSVSVKPISD
jgi:hypothetical protein